MIYGIGIDLLKISRIEALLKRHAGLSRIFGAAELSQLKAINRAESYAANFCAKEAFSKALGTGIRGFRLSEAEVLRDKAGKPYLSLSGNAKRMAESRNLIFHVSLTHSGPDAAAVVVAETPDEKPGTTNQPERRKLINLQERCAAE